jgi:cytochrome c-type biogenesis protein CcmH/NrfG
VQLERDPSNLRAVFYLAQTHRDLGDRERAVRTGWESPDRRSRPTDEAFSLMVSC